MRCNSALSLSRFSEAFASRLPLQVCLQNSKAVTTPLSLRITVRCLDRDRPTFRQLRPVFARQMYTHVGGNQTRDSFAPIKESSNQACGSTSTRVHPPTSTRPSASHQLGHTTVRTTPSDKILQPSTLSRRRFFATLGRLLAAYARFQNGAPPIPFETPTRAGFWQVIKEDLFSVCPSSQYSFLFSSYTSIILMICDSLMTRKSGASSISPITEWIGSTNCTEPWGISPLSLPIPVGNPCCSTPWFSLPV